MQSQTTQEVELTYRVIGLAMRVHRRFGPGLLEHLYEACLCYELAQTEIPFRRQVPIPVHYGDTVLDCAYIADIIVGDQIILELKAVERVLPIHEVQLLTYLRLTDCRVGLLINFNTVSLTDGIRRRVL
jgi:GxxExxY protein